MDVCGAIINGLSLISRDNKNTRAADRRYFDFDIITEYASREMTLDEIEKELGYKVKIINKEKSDGNGKKM